MVLRAGRGDERATCMERARAPLYREPGAPDVQVLLEALIGETDRQRARAARDRGKTRVLSGPRQGGGIVAAPACKGELPQTRRAAAIGGEDDLARVRREGEPEDRRAVGGEWARLA